MISAVGSLFLIFFLADTANGIRCFSCNHANDVDCKWGSLLGYDNSQCTMYGAKGEVVSSGKCYKLKVHRENGETVIVKRGCLFETETDCDALIEAYLPSDDPHFISRALCETCETDLCNSANSLGPLTLVGIMLSFIVGLVIL